jgi:branched-subunit amino acid transport protein
MNTAIGPYSQFDTYGNKNTSLGTFSLSNLGVGYNNTAIGAYSNSQNNLNENKFNFDFFQGGGNNNTSIGAHALSYQEPLEYSINRKLNSFNQNTAIGAYSLSALTVDLVDYGGTLVSNSNTAIGYKAGSTLEIGSNNIIIGDSAQTTSTTVSNQIVIGNASNTSSYIYGALTTAGRISKLVTVTSNYTILGSDEIISANATSPINIYLPTAVGIAGRTYTIKNINTGSVTLRPSSSQNIDGSNTYELTNRYSFVKVISNGSNWLVAGLDNVSYSVSGGLTLTDLISSNVKAKTFELTQPSSINSTSTTTLDLSTGNVLQVVLTGSTTLAFTNPKIGTYIIKIKQDATGNRTLNFPTIKWADAAVPTITPTANAVDLLTIIYDGVDYYGSCLQNF